MKLCRVAKPPFAGISWALLRELIPGLGSEFDRLILLAFAFLLLEVHW